MNPRGVYASSHEQYVNEAKRTLENLAYRNEQAMKLDKLVAKFTQTVDELERRKKWLYNSNVVDIIWKEKMNIELSQYVTALRVKFQQQPLGYL